MKVDFKRPLDIDPSHLEVAKPNPWSRVGGKLVDNFIESTIAGVLLALFVIIIHNTTTTNIDDYATVILVVYQVISLFLNLIVPVLTKGQTIGKMAAKTRVVSYDGNVANIIIYLVRQSFFTVIALLIQVNAISTIALVAYGIVYVICTIQLFADNAGRTLQDRFARTMVVDNLIWKQYREKAFFEMDHPELFVDAEEEVNDESVETTTKEADEALDESINKEEEIY